jgi:C4-dicarboxylate-specific signal transduction histidine kinase
VHLAHYDNKKELIFRVRNVTNSQLKHKQQSAIAISSRISAVGEMVSALAHEINQPLAAINAYSRGCLHILKSHPNPQLSLPLEKIAAQAELAGDIIHNMKSFMREGSIYLEETDINQLINDTITILHYELLDSKFKINVRLVDKLPKLMTNKIHIMQVILNLARNSIEALESIQEADPHILIQTNVLNDFVHIHIKDNGPGIAKEFKNLILNTYFTTKNKGTGIGLGICRKLIEEHGGKLSFQEHEERGAWFTFTLPSNLNSRTTNGKH